jgi:hypothetical protein
MTAAGACRIVDRLADRWGVARPGTVVWFELAAS